MHPLEVRFTKEQQASDLGLSEQRLLVAVSGGADSIALCQLLHAAELTFALAHVNYGLRPESQSDASFVESYASSLSAQCFVYQVTGADKLKLEGASTQAWAREIRYRFFHSLAARNRYDYILTAHHADDVAETILLHLMRGRDQQILKGIHAVHDKLYRPLLEYTKAELVGYLNDTEQSWREDSSNATTDYLRNHVRHRILPLLTELHPNPVRQLNQRLVDYRSQQDYINRGVETDLSYLLTDKGRVFQLEQSDEETPLTLLIDRWLRSTVGADYKAVDEVVQLANAQKGKYVTVNSYRIVREEGTLEIQEAPTETTTDEWQITQADLPLTLVLYATGEQLLLEIADNGLRKPNSESIDSEGLVWPLTLRTWQAGDRVQLLGMTGTQKVSDILTNLKLASQVKQQAVVLCDQQGIVWVQHARIAERVKVTNSTQKALKISFLGKP